MSIREDLHIESRLKSPSIDCSYSEKLVRIEGRSIMENPSEFYEPLNNWIDKYIVLSNSQLHVELKFDFVNSSSKRVLFPIFRKFHKLRKVSIKWFYASDDPDLKELGEDYKEGLNLSMDLIPTTDDN